MMEELLTGRGGFGRLTRSRPWLLSCAANGYAVLTLVGTAPTSALGMCILLSQAVGSADPETCQLMASEFCKVSPTLAGVQVAGGAVAGSSPWASGRLQR